MSYQHKKDAFLSFLRNSDSCKNIKFRRHNVINSDVSENMNFEQVTINTVQEGVKIGVHMNLYSERCNVRLFFKMESSVIKTNHQFEATPFLELKDLSFNYGVTDAICFLDRIIDNYGDSTYDFEFENKPDITKIEKDIIELFLLFKTTLDKVKTMYRVDNNNV